MIRSFPVDFDRSQYVFVQREHPFMTLGLPSFIGIFRYTLPDDGILYVTDTFSAFLIPMACVNGRKHPRKLQASFYRYYVALDLGASAIEQCGHNVRAGFIKKCSLHEDTGSADGTLV